MFCTLRPGNDRVKEFHALTGVLDLWLGSLVK